MTESQLDSRRSPPPSVLSPPPFLPLPLPEGREKKEVSTDNEIVEVFRLFTEHKQDAIMFEIEKRPYIPVALDVEASFSTTPKFTGDIPTVDFSGFEQNLFGDNEGDYYYEDGHDYEGDNEYEVELGDEVSEVGLGDQFGDDGSVDVGEVLAMRALAVLPEVLEEEWYQSKSDDEYCSDSGDEVSGAELAWVIKSNPFKQLGFNFNKVKTFKNEHTCHRIYKSKEAKAKWIAGKFQDHVISNPGIQAYVISHLLSDQFNVIIDTQRLYKANKRALERMFVSFEAQRKGFLKGCRPFLGLDGCHLKGPYGGILLSALRVFPNYPEDKPICFMSDKQKGVIGALKMPRASIRFCARHIYANFKTSYGGQKLRRLFWRASKTADRFEFKKLLADIAFNNMLKDFRPMTYLQLMEFIKRLVMSRFQLRKDECNSWKIDIPLCVNKKILENSEESRTLRTLHSGGGKYEMLGIGRAYTANLHEKTCECGQWQVSRVPCSHAFARIRHHYGVNGDKGNLVEFINPILSKSAYLRTYNSMIHPIPDLCIWADLETSKVDPPPLKRLPGRPRLVKKRESGEKQKASKTGTVVCGKCKELEHNFRKKVSNTTDDVSVSSSQCATTSSQPSTKRQRAPRSKAVVGSSSQPTQYFGSTSGYVSCNMNYVNYENVAIFW
ncbi:hypothetical protein EZV62_002096 [Acer yangbiense]|uniref:SWIM-type domain-containing protein n=1 Tax=Acer yangbiense TaxID=1000413 RepID=A0A5C7IW24_9ROSI|nr:hypothetical protein EZV62_002096 [Acer yangbiense]